MFRRKIGIKDRNGKEIRIGDKIEMHYFFENHDPVTLGAFEDEKLITGIVGVDFWGTYTETSDGKKYYWLHYLEEPEEELEIMEG